jgi:two-component system, sensor histidine kinase and response regulator
MKLKIFSSPKEKIEARRDFFKRIYPAVKESRSVWARYQRLRHPKLYEYSVQEEKRARVARANASLRNEVKTLKASNGELTDLLKQKDDFFGIMSHDLRTPFTGIIGFLGLLNDNFSELQTGQPLTKAQLDENRKCLSIAMSSSEQAFALLDRFLEIYRINSGKLDFTPKNFDLSKAVAAKVELYSANARKKGIALESGIPKGTVVFANPEMTGEVVGNLLSNAIKFTNPGGEVRISCRSTTGNQIEVSVSDNGVGISQAALTNLLVNNTGTTTVGTGNEKGTGFGIHKVREIVSRMGGSFMMESEVGKGTVCAFTVMLAEPSGQTPRTLSI